MSAEDFTLNAKSRGDQGKGASRRLRHDNLVPAIVYGGEKDPQNIAIAHNELTKQLENEAFYSHIVSLVIDDKKEDVILKDLQRHPSKPVILHADFLRVSKTQKFTTRVPLHYVNEEACKGVKLQGGVISHNMTELEITCLPQDLPEFIEIDLKDAEVGQIIHISDLALPKGVESVALSHGTEHDQPVVTIAKGRGGDGDAEGEEEGGDE